MTSFFANILLTKIYKNKLYEMEDLLKTISCTNAAHFINLSRYSGCIII